MFLKRTILSVAQTVGVSALARRATARQLRILCYHGLWLTPGYQFSNCTFIAPEQFERHMAQLKYSGLPVLPLGEAVELLQENRLPKAAVAITIDDGWASTFTHMLPVLERLGLPSTLYATTWYAGKELPVVNVAVDYLCKTSGRLDIDPDTITAQIEAMPVSERLEALRAFGRDLRVDEAWLHLRQFNIMSANEFAEARKRGMDVQLHTHRHINVETQFDNLSFEIEENRQHLTAALGEVPLHHFCYPSGFNHPRAPEVLAASGVRSATMVTPGLNAPGTSPYALRRFLDGRSVSDAEFAGYLSGILHCVEPLKALARRRKGTSNNDLYPTSHVH